MSYELSNLELSWVDRPEERWVDDLESMVEGYPFEKGRRETLGEDRLSRLRSTWENPGETSLLAAHFDSKLVGWLQLEPDELLSSHAPVPFVRARHELVQRNRDDVRHHLLEAVRERYPDALVEFRQPTQNRTARSYLLGQPDVVAGTTLVHLARTGDRDEPSTDSELNSVRTNPRSLPAFEDLPGAPHNDLLAPVLDDARWAEAFAGDLPHAYTTADHRDLLALVSDSTTRAVLLLEEQPNGSGDPIVRARALTKSDDVDGLRTLLSAAEDFVGEGILEVRIDSERETLFETLQEINYEPLTKRMLLYRLPSELQSDSEGIRRERTRS